MNMSSAWQPAAVVGELPSGLLLAASYWRLFGRLPSSYTVLPTGAEPSSAWEFPFPQGNTLARD